MRQLLERVNTEYRDPAVFTSRCAPEKGKQGCGNVHPRFTAAGLRTAERSSSPASTTEARVKESRVCVWRSDPQPSQRWACCTGHTEGPEDTVLRAASQTQDRRCVTHSRDVPGAPRPCGQRTARGQGGRQRPRDRVRCCKRKGPGVGSRGGCSVGVHLGPCGCRIENPSNGRFCYVYLVKQKFRNELRT